MALMDHLILVHLLGLEVWDVEGPHRLERGEDRVVERTPAFGNAQVLADLPQRPEDARPIETLSLAVFAEAHGVYFPSFTTMATLRPSGATAIRVTAPSLWIAPS
jgi:hypothetical protein